MSWKTWKKYHVWVSASQLFLLGFVGIPFSCSTQPPGFPYMQKWLPDSQRGEDLLHCSVEFLGQHGEVERATTLFPTRCLLLDPILQYSTLWMMTRVLDGNCGGSQAFCWCVKEMTLPFNSFSESSKHDCWEDFHSFCLNNTELWWFQQALFLYSESFISKRVP